MREREEGERMNGEGILNDILRTLKCAVSMM
jgi:hypothetical protein